MRSKIRCDEEFWKFLQTEQGLNTAQVANWPACQVLEPMITSVKNEELIDG